MRIAIVSDLHEDFRNLERVLADARRRGFDSLVCLGDITGYADLYHGHVPDAGSCIDLLLEHGAVCIAGNHDLFTIRKLPSYHQRLMMPDTWYELDTMQQAALTHGQVWLYEEEILPVLQPEHKQFLQELPEWIVLPAGNRNILCSHFYAPDATGFTRWFPSGTRELRAHFHKMQAEHCSLAFVGHSHPEGVQAIQQFVWSDPLYRPFEAGPAQTIVCCPPVVSGIKSSGYMLYDATTGYVTPVFL